MAYTPELSASHSARLRRIAWAAGLPMTTTMTEIIDFVLSSFIDRELVCFSCQDDSFYAECSFNKKREQAAAGGDFRILKLFKT